MFYICEKKSEKVHTFPMATKTKKGTYDNSVKELRSFIETGKTTKEGLKAVAGVTAENKTHVLIWVKEK